MRHVLGILGVTAAIVLLLVSAAMNWQFGASLGKTEFDALIFSFASAASDGLKALLPFFIFAALRNRNYSQALGGVGLMVICICYSLASALGFAALNRADTTGSRALQVEKYEDLRTELMQIREQQSWLAQHRPVGTVEAEIDAAKQHVRWQTTAGCTDATVDKSRAYCEHYHKLHAELAVAHKGDALAARAAEVNARLSKVRGETATKKADPQAELFSALLGLDIERIRTGLLILVALLVELGSSLGLYVSFSYWRLFDGRKPRAEAAAPVVATAVEIIRPEPVQQQLAPPKSDVEQYFDERIQQEDGSSVTALALYEDYREWCDLRGRQPLGLPIFNRQFAELGIQKAKIAGRIRYIGIRMIAAEEEDRDSDFAAVS